MRTDDLIAQLSGGLQPVKKGVVERTLAVGLICGILGSVFLMLVTVGVRPDLAQAMTGGAFWMKLAYTMAIAGLGLWLVERSSRPGVNAMQPLALLMLPVLGITVLMAMQLAPAEANRHALIMGQSSKVCALLIALLSIPLFVGLFWALRKLAPTRLTQAGASAGLLAGSVAASIYAFHCTESAAPFVAIWYTAGIALATLFGAALGRWALRW